MSAPTVKFYDNLREKAAPLFAGWDETLITSCLQGIMGQIYVSEECGGLPESAAAVLGDFCFLAGKPDREKLLEYVKKLPEPYQLHQIDKELYRQCRKQDWSRDLVAQFPDFETYKQLGLGMVVTKDSIPAGTRRTSGQSHWQKNSDTPDPMTTRCMK